MNSGSEGDDKKQGRLSDSDVSAERKTDQRSSEPQSDLTEAVAAEGTAGEAAAGSQSSETAWTRPDTETAETVDAVGDDRTVEPEAAQPAPRKSGGGGFLWVLALIGAVGAGSYFTKDMWYDQVAGYVPFLDSTVSDQAPSSDVTPAATDADVAEAPADDATQPAPADGGPAATPADTETPATSPDADVAQAPADADVPAASTGDDTTAPAPTAGDPAATSGDAETAATAPEADSEADVAQAPAVGDVSDGDVSEQAATADIQPAPANGDTTTAVADSDTAPAAAESDTSIVPGDSDTAAADGGMAPPSEAADLDVADERLAEMAEQLAMVEARIDDLEARLGLSEAEGQPSLPERLERLEAGVQPIEPIETRLSALEGADQVDQAQVGRETALVLAVGQLRQVLTSSGAYGAQLNALRTVVADDADLQPMVESLEPYAEMGVPTEDALRTRFPAVARDVTKAKQGTSGEDWMARAINRLTSLVTIRRTGDAAVAAGGTDAVLTEAKAALDTGDLGGAVTALEQLEGSAAAAAQPWLEDAKARLDVESALAGLQSAALSRLATERG